MVREGSPVAWAGDVPARAWLPPSATDLVPGLPAWNEAFTPVAAGCSAAASSSSSSGGGAIADTQLDRPLLHLVRPLFGARADHAGLLAELDAAYQGACAALRGGCVLPASCLPALWQQLCQAAGCDEWQQLWCACSLDREAS